MKKFEQLLGTFTEFLLLRIDLQGNILDTLINTKKNLDLSSFKNIHEIFSKEETFRLSRVIEANYSGKKKFMELNPKLGIQEYVDVDVNIFEKEIYMYIQFFQSNRVREVIYDRYVEKLVNLSEKDPLTNVLNRHGFWEKVKSLLISAQDPERRLGIIYVDIDNLKQINDMYGHEAGDEIILSIAGTLCETVRQRDLVTRQGGDEFAIVLEEISGIKSTAYGLAKRLLREVNKLQGEHTTTISLGVHIIKLDKFLKVQKDEEKLQTLWLEAMKKADEAAYKAKQAGRNRIELSKGFHKYYKI